MRDVKVRKRKVIHAESPEGYEEAFNKFIDSLGGVETTVIDLPDKEGYQSIVEYYTTMPGRETLSIKDEFAMNGIRYLCKNCPYMDKPKDGRYKRTTCAFSERGVTFVDREACDLFYTKLAQHELKPLEDWNEK